MSIERVVSKFERELESARAVKATFQESFLKDAAYALTWGTSVFAAAAAERVYDQLLQYIAMNDTCTEDVTMKEMTQLVHDKVLYRARYPAQSTSPTSNLMEQYEMAAWAEAHHYLKYYTMFEER